MNTSVEFTFLFFFFNDAQVILDQKRVYPAFKNADFIITSTGLEIAVEIPLIQAQVTYTGSSFGIDLAFSLFKNNTEGQCGEYLVHSLSWMNWNTMYI